MELKLVDTARNGVGERPPLSWCGCWGASERKKQGHVVRPHLRLRGVFWCVRREVKGGQTRWPPKSEEAS